MKFLAVLSLFSASGLVFGAPMSLASLDAATLLQNAKDAQILNAEFKQLNKTDACNTGQLACIGGAKAQCAFGAWTIQRCRATEQCFALPSLTGNGTTLTCTSEATALSVLHAAGAQGGVTANSTSAAVAFPTASSVPSGQGTNGVAVVTVTVTVLPSPSSETRTLDPAAAASFISSLTANGASIVTTIPPTAISTPPSVAMSTPILTATPTPSANDNNEASAAPVVADASSPVATTILLTNQPVSPTASATSAASEVTSGLDSSVYKRAMVGGRAGRRAF